MQTYIDKLIKRQSDLSVCRDDMMQCLQIIINSYRKKGKMLVCGNGGSAADAEHIVGELMKGFVLPRTLDKNLQDKIQDMFPNDRDYLVENLQMGLPTISLVNQISLSTAFANDRVSELGFAQQVLGVGNQGDILLAISTSGNSANVLYAAKVAKIKGMQVIGLTGKMGNKLKEIADISICVPAIETFRIQEYHIMVYHALCLAIENEFFN